MGFIPYPANMDNMVIS